jgi:hypothetical protein
VHPRLLRPDAPQKRRSTIILHGSITQYNSEHHTRHRENLKSHIPSLGILVCLEGERAYATLVGHRSEYVNNSPCTCTVGGLYNVGLKYIAVHECVWIFLCKYSSYRCNQGINVFFYITLHYIHIHFIDPTFVRRRVNMKHVRKCRLLSITY